MMSARQVARERNRCLSRFKTGEAVGAVQCKRAHGHRGAHKAAAPWGSVSWTEKMPPTLTEQQERELRRMVVGGPQTSHGTAFVRVHNNLVRAGLARLVEISGITHCAVTDEGRALLSNNDSPGGTK